MDTDRFLVHVKTKDIYADFAVIFEKQFDTSTYEIVIQEQIEVKCYPFNER